MTHQHLATCQLCGETIHAEHLLNHFRLFHPDLYDQLGDLHNTEIITIEENNTLGNND